MRARAIRPIPETDRHKAYMPGEFLDAMSKDDISAYIFEDMAAWLKEDNPQTKKARRGQGVAEVEDEE